MHLKSIINMHATNVDGDVRAGLKQVKHHTKWLLI